MALILAGLALVLALLAWLMTHPEAGHHHSGQINVGSRAGTHRVRVRVAHEDTARIESDQLAKTVEHDLKRGLELDCDRYPGNV